MGGERESSTSNTYLFSAFGSRASFVERVDGTEHFLHAAVEERYKLGLMQETKVKLFLSTYLDHSHTHGVSLVYNQFIFS